ncbi:MAG: hypothetical protein NTY03_10700 [Candidatus Bathyarchaeota archaeon]|nr:hypothetical protein [Candidatus Bathyarchaeota archaeon]
MSAENIGQSSHNQLGRPRLVIDPMNGTCGKRAGPTYEDETARLGWEPMMSTRPLSSVAPREPCLR